IYRTDVKLTKYKHFSNVPRMKPSFTPRLDIGNQYVTCGNKASQYQIFQLDDVMPICHYLTVQ
ncbi:MAG: hypothetical protein WBZ36_03095, partial [Candidatus Nitrosopolaris sp.]